MNKLLKGIVCANITPFDKNHNIDYQSVKRLARYLVDSGINAVYPLGTNGEGLSLSIEERKKVAQIMAEEINGSITVAIQCGTQTFEGTRELVQHAKDIGADAAGVITPFFFKQSQEAMEEYYSMLLNSVKDFPIYIYNIPSHTNNDLLPSVISKLAEKYQNLVGVKYSHPDIIRLSEYIAVRPDNFDTLIGCDSLIYPAAEVGAVGTVSGPAAVFPELFSSLWKAITEDDHDKALKLQRIIRENDNALAKYQSIPLLKLYLKSKGVIEETQCRIPFRKVSETEENEILKLVGELRAKGQ